MTMPITVYIVDEKVTQKDIDAVFDYFKYIEEKFSTFKDTSEVSAINRGELKENEYSEDMKEVFRLSAETKRLTNGFFNIEKANKKLDPAGLVKGWAIYNAAKLVEKMGYKNYYVEAGGDIQVSGHNEEGNKWTIGIKDPFDPEQKRIVKVVSLKNEGIATSGTYLRGQHIYNPHDNVPKPITDIISLTVIGENIYEADRFATAAFAMGRNGISFIETFPGLEAYMIDAKGIATMTSNFEKYLAK